jgi:methionyl-tRNA formyltransferase
VRIVYFGSPSMAVPLLEALIGAGHDIPLVVSNPDRRRSRRGDLQPTPVKAAALNAGLRVTDDPNEVLGVAADLGVVVAFGQIIRPPLLEHLKMLNIHFSLLPRWRGAAPVERAILAGDSETGVCIMEVAEGLDTGDVYARCKVPIGAEQTAAELREVLVGLGNTLLVETLADELPQPIPQSESGATYAKKLSTDDLRVDWSGSAEQEARKVRVGGAWTTFREKRLKVVSLASPPVTEGTGGPPGSIAAGRVECGSGALAIAEVQPEGKKVLAFADWVNGAQPGPEERLRS